MASNIIWIVMMLDIASRCSRKQLSWGVCHHSGSWWENMLLCDEPTLKSPPKVHFDGMCVAALHCETVVHWDGWEIWHWHRWWLHYPPSPIRRQRVWCVYRSCPLTVLDLMLGDTQTPWLMCFGTAKSPAVHLHMQWPRLASLLTLHQHWLEQPVKGTLVQHVSVTTATFACDCIPFSSWLLTGLTGTTKWWSFSEY